ncbi:MAG: type II toxin-antitoxin system prevent-host-death family antitoxin [Chloroflexi bacterium]|nr:type II toxin-antitoxin system prevent-host-death family antitoxin [Chloroflexota bacterium]
MDTIGAFEAKTRLSALLDRVADGERITITRHGMPVAIFVPITAGPQMTPVAAAERLRALRRGVTLGDESLRGESLRDLIEEGRR